MDCRKAQRFVRDFADGQLADGVARELQRHLADCTDCRVTQQRAAHLQQLLSIKRHEQPGATYFEGFIADFHRRLAAETAPQPRWWERWLSVHRIQNVPTLRYGFAHAFGVLVAVGMIVRAMISTDLSSDLPQANALSFGSSHLQAASALPAPHSLPRTIASTLPPSSEPTSTAGSALIIPMAARDESSAPRYVLDRISLTPASYEVASISF